MKIMPALYQKYRPQKFADLVNQNHIKISLQNEIAQDKIGHAYLFYGPRAVGKTTTARLLAKAANCEQRKTGDSEPCNTCSSCLEITGDRSLDVVEMDAASNTGVDNVRENIIANVRVVATKSRYKIFIIDEAQMLSQAAFNALLKTLEEPPKNIIFILATTEVHKIPATIISRCQKFGFKKVNNDAMFERLQYLTTMEQKQVPAEVLNNIVRQAGGYVRDAESLLGQILSLDDKQITKEQADIVLPISNFNLVSEFIELLLNKNTAGAIKQLNDLIENGIDLVQFNKDLIFLLRQLLLSKICNTVDACTVNLDFMLEEKIAKLKDAVDVNYLIKALNTFISRGNELGDSEIIQLPLEIAIIELNEQAAVSTQQPKNSFLSIGDKINFFSKKNLDQNKKSVVTEEFKNDNQSNDPGITFAQLLQKWPLVVEKVKKTEPAISFMIGAAKPQNLTGRILEICFQHQFHCDSLQGNGKQAKLEKIFQEVLNVDLRIKCSVGLTINNDLDKVVVPIAEVKNDNQELTDEKDSADLNGLLEMFGGKVVD